MVYDEVQTRPQVWSKPNRRTYCSEKARPSDKPSECAPMCSTLPHNMRLNGLQEGKDNRNIMLCVSTTKINHFLLKIYVIACNTVKSAFEVIRLDKQIREL